MENKIEIIAEGVLKVVVNGEVIAMVHNDLVKRSQVIYACKEMGAEDIKNLLLTITEKNDGQIKSRVNSDTDKRGD